MNGDPRESVRREERLDEVIAEYLVDLEAGRAPDREQFLARYPDLAPDLAEFLNDRDRIQALVSPTAMEVGSPPRTCPQCRGPLEKVADGTTCDNCGGGF